MRKIEHAAQPLEDWREGVEDAHACLCAATAQRNCAYSSNGWRQRLARRRMRHPVEEVLTVLSGEAECGSTTRDTALTRGQSIVVPAHEKHGFRNTGSDALHIHAVLAAPIFEASYDGSGPSMRRWAHRELSSKLLSHAMAVLSYRRCGSGRLDDSGVSSCRRLPDT